MGMQQAPASSFRREEVNVPSSWPVSRPNCILFFDGPCVLCQNSLRRLVKHERPRVDALCGELAFAPLQGKTATDLLPAAWMAEPVTEVVLCHIDGQMWTGAAAIRKLSCRLTAPWRHLLRCAPAWGYRAVAQQRHRFWSRCDVCEWSPSISVRLLP